MKSITTYVIYFLGGLIPELTLSYIVMKFMDEGWWVFWVTYIAIQVFYFIVWFFRSIVNWLFFIAFWKRQMVKDFYEALIRHNYPIENHNVCDKTYAKEYFEDIFYDPQLQAETRINAGAFCTSLNVFLELGNLQGFFHIRKADFEALNKYFSAKDARINPQSVKRGSYE